MTIMPSDIQDNTDKDRIIQAATYAYPKDEVLHNLYKVFAILPICPLLGVVGDAIQTLQYYETKEQR